MIKDDILRMAREAKLPDPMVFYASIERFTALVAAEVGLAEWHRGFAEGQAAGSRKFHAHHVCVPCSQKLAIRIGVLNQGLAAFP